MNWRCRLNRQLNPSDGRPSLLNGLVGGLIGVSIAVAILATEPAVEQRHALGLERLDRLVGCLFVLEYGLRAWVAPLNPAYGSGWRGLLRYLRTPLALLDLAALLPLVIGALGAELYILRLVRLVRIARVGRSRRFKHSLRHFHYAIQSRWQELQISVVYTAMFVLLAAVGMYLAEGARQPQLFGSIPRALWWSVMTVTTVGYGDVVPVTAAGRLIAAFTALVGIGAIAIPTGILASGFSDSVARERDGGAEP
jgi:voltage-gated potassium channel